MPKISSCNLKASLKIVENSKYKVIRTDKTYLTKFSVKNWQIYEKEHNLKWQES